MNDRLTRRALLGRTGLGLGSLALASLVQPRLWSGEPAVEGRWRGIVDPLHLKPRAKRVIVLGMAGGPSHLETFDHKPKLAELDGKPMPDSYTKGQPIAQLQGQELKILGPQHAFAKVGASGQEISVILPHHAAIADDICIVRSMVTEAINHDPAQTFMNTGSTISGRPAMGSWLDYGLGSECADLPGFVVLTSVGGGQGQPIAARQWHSGFLPSRFQGVPFHGKGDPVLYVGNPDGVDRARQGEVVDAIGALDRANHALVDDPEIQTRISQYEMAYRMQASVPGLMDLADESEETFALYGTRGGDGSFAANCLLARRLAERGVRFIQLYHRGWDHHGGVKAGTAGTAGLTDRACMALITDLKRRGLLEDTLVLWWGEFGRTPMAQGDGRDHHIKGFSMWLAGGGVKPGMTYGATDELGYHAVDDVVHVHDIHATMLHLLGIDHRRLTMKFQGRDFRLTDVSGHVVKALLA
ncbi:MAG TPA: DUF1501 domain-containing protein [Planctomycetota bacterium]|nr:DUF1501 domain-containing protein [Planctomycetota bacterium]